MDTHAIRVAAVDDHPVVLRGVRAAATDSAIPLQFIATATTVAELLAEAPQADVVLLDLQLDDSSRPRDNVRALCEHGYKVLIYTEGTRRSWIADALRAGALGVVTKGQDESALFAAIASVHQGELAVTAEMADVLHADEALRPQLAPREEETLRLVAQGLADKQAARVMGISEDTVKEYLKRIRQKYANLGRPVASRVDLHRRAAEDGYLEGQEPPGGRSAV